MSRMSENVGASTSRNPTGLHGLYRDNFAFAFAFAFTFIFCPVSVCQLLNFWLTWKNMSCYFLIQLYCDTMPESQNSEVKIDVHY
jgi:hypothetical protein